MDEARGERHTRTRRTPPPRDSIETQPDADVSTQQVRATPAADTEEASGGELLRRARDLLLERGEPLSVSELASHVFGVAAAIAGVSSPWERMVTKLLDQSSVFSHH
ncbi:MAG: hypothetical protein ACXWP6_12945, partial [Ktedonobacterales bacterium]